MDFYIYQAFNIGPKETTGVHSVKRIFKWHWVALENAECYGWYYRLLKEFKTTIPMAPFTNMNYL